MIYFHHIYSFCPIFYSFDHNIVRFQPFLMVMGSNWRCLLGVLTHRFRPVFLQSFPVLVLSGLDFFRSFPVLVWSSLGLFPVLRLDLQTLVTQYRRMCMHLYTNWGCAPRWQAGYVTGSENANFCKFSPEICSAQFRRIIIWAQDENPVSEPSMTKESKKSALKTEYRSNSMHDLSYSLRL